MKTLIGNMMSGVLEVVLWLNIVACIIIGYNIGNGMNHHYFIGAIIGIIAGFVINVFEGGFFLLLMEIRNSVSEIAETNAIIKDYVEKIAGKNETAIVTASPPTPPTTTTKNEAHNTKKAGLDMDSLLSK